MEWALSTGIIPQLEQQSRKGRGPRDPLEDEPTIHLYVPGMLVRSIPVNAHTTPSLSSLQEA